MSGTPELKNRRKAVKHLKSGVFNMVAFHVEKHLKLTAGAAPEQLKKTSKKSFYTFYNLEAILGLGGWSAAGGDVGPLSNRRPCASDVEILPK